MITHQIVKHKTRVRISNVTPIVQQQNRYLEHTPPHGGVVSMHNVGYIMGKFEYAKMLQGLELKKDDYCFLKGTAYPVEENDIWKVFEINECHWMDPGNRPDKSGPQPYLLVNRLGEKMRAAPSWLLRYAASDREKF